MSCTKCAVTFGLFNREHGCAKCHFSFCKRCCSKKSPSDDKKHVCNSCYDSITRGVVANQPTRHISPPKNYLARVEALAAKQKGATTTNQAGLDKRGRHQKRPTPSQAELEAKFQRLKEDKRRLEGPPPSQQDVVEYLARLKGQPLPPSSKGQRDQVFYQPPDRRTQTEKTSDLLKQMQERVEIDSRNPDAVTDISARLEHLRQPINEPNSDNNLNRDTPKTEKRFEKNIESSLDASNNADKDDVKRIIEQAESEVELDKKLAEEGVEKDNILRERLAEIKKFRLEQEKNAEQAKNDAKGVSISGSSKGAESRSKKAAVTDDFDLPFCCVCERNATLRCKECDMELYCDRCFKEMHKEYGIGDHTSTKYARHHSNEDNSAVSADDDDELPWCCICNEDASLRCHGCDGDLYCRRCFKECHEEFEIGDHETSPFKPRK